MKRKVLALVLTGIMCLSFTGCMLPASKGSYTVKQDDSRFMKVSSLDGWIYVDKETKVQYLYVKRVNAGGLTVLLNADGTPLLYED